MKRLRGGHVCCLLILQSLLAPALLAAAPLRSQIVMARGQKVAHTAAAQLVTITLPPGADASIVRHGFEQYGQNVAIEALKPGEIKLQLEGTNSRIGEIVTVVVTEKKTWDLYRRVVGALSGVEGISDRSIQVAGDRVVVAATLFSAADLQKCIELESTPGIVCAAQLSSAAAVVYPDTAYRPRGSIELTEQPAPAASATVQGLEGVSTWRAVLRLGDVPFLALVGSRADVMGRSADFASRFNRAAAEWTKRTDRGLPYPATFRRVASPGGYEVTMQWRHDQGTRGDVLMELAGDAIDPRLSASTGGVDRLLQWSSAILQDSFRLYFLGQRPSRTVTPTEPGPVAMLYDRALRLGGEMTRVKAPTLLARGFYSMKLSSGSDPFDRFVGRIPPGFEAAP
ncbi:MAG TPA: hypothetical protein VMT00_11950 [Thermoanaerobaculia bacterium]|nr:hypothetical protein [Thermoanaerobaculia bacterium]